MMHRSLAALVCGAGMLVTSSLLGACNSASPGPDLAALTLDECDPAAFVACNQQAAFLSIPIADTGLSLTYSSQWAPARTDRPNWSASSLGLGGWSLDVVQRYDIADGILIGGDGSWRFASGVSAASGGRVVPSFDGSVAYVFDSAGRLVRTVDGHLGIVLLTFTYDSSGRLTSVGGTANSGPAHLTVRRAPDGTPVALEGIDGAVTSVALDTSGLLVGVTNPAGAPTQLTWGPHGLVTSETDALGGVTRFTYDSAGRLVSSTDADGVVQRLSRTTIAGGVEIRATTALGRVSVYRAVHAGGGVRLTYIAPGGATTIETMADNGSRTLSLPDGTRHQIGAQPSAIWGLAAPLLTPDTETRPGSVTSHTTVSEDLRERGDSPYTVAGSITRRINGDDTVETFDPVSRTTTVTDPSGRQSVDTYDARGRLVASRAPGSAPVTYTYDVRGREVAATVGSGSLAQTTRFAYNTSTGTITKTLPNGMVTTEEVDAAGSAATITAADGSMVVESYDAAGRLTGVQPPGGLSYTLGTSPAGRPTAFLPPQVGSDATIETARYDSDGNVVSVSGLGPQPVSVAYDTAGRITGLTFDQGTTSASFDSTSGLVARTSDPDGVTTAYGYSGALLDSLSWSGPLTGSVSVILDANGRAVSESTDGSAALTLAYDASGDLTGIGQLLLTRDPSSGLVTSTTLGSVTTDDQYDSNDQLVRATTSASGKVLLDIRYQRDALGRISAVVQTGADGATTTTAYTYDSAGRVSAVQVAGSTVETDRFDAAGNRIAVASRSGTTKATYDARDELTSWGGTTYTWAPDGALAGAAASAGATAYTYDDLGRLRSVKLTNGHTITYLIDADGRRVGREVDGKLVTGYLYDPAGNVAAETDGTGAVLERFGYDDLGHLALVERGGSTYRVITDQVGSPRLVVDPQTGAIVDAISYDEWGRITSETAPGTIPFGFTGGLLDANTGFVHLGARDLDTVTGRWTGPDALRFGGGDTNLYRYAGGDPVNGTDPTGLRYTISGPCDLLYASLYCNAQTAVDVYRHFFPPSPPPPPPPAWSCTGDCSNRSGWLCSGQCNGGSGLVDCHGYCTGPNGEICQNGDCYFGSDGFLVCAASFCQNQYQSCASECSYQGYGDTHLLTGDATHIDFQAAGEFEAVESPDRNLDVQVRQQPWPGETTIAVTTSVAANVDGDHVGVYTREPSFLIINGAALHATDISEKLPHGGSLQRHGGVIILTWLNNSQLTITDVAGTLSYSLHPAATASPGLTGLLGSAGVANAVKGRDGSVLQLSDPAFGTKLYTQFGDSWRITQAESLFDYQPGESTRTFTDLSIPTANATAASLPASVAASAKTVCGALGVETEPLLDDCILDVGATGDPALAAASAAVAASGIVGTSPAPTTNAGELVLGQPVSGTLRSTSQRNDYTFAASAGDVVFLKARGTCVDGLYWGLFRPDGTRQDFNLTCRDVGRQMLATSGTWTVRVYSDGTAAGAYAFTVLAAPALTTQAISVDQPVTGTVDQIGAWHDYTFSASVGEVVYLKAQGTCVALLYWELYRPDGIRQDFANSCGDMGRQVLAISGTWTVRIYSDTTATGSYAFTVSLSQ
ncbi:MAG: RHS repeat-associated core domain-containing protein [Candidatus Dormiibacterota bacterium]